jgi:hypothetical protein
MKLIRKVKQSKINFFNTNKIVIFTYNKLIIIKKEVWQRKKNG